MSDAPDPALLKLELERTLRSGLRSEDLPVLAGMLGSPREATEWTVAQALLRRSAELQASEVGLLQRGGRSWERTEERGTAQARSSLFAGLSPAGGEQHGAAIEHLDDLRTLLAFVRAGSVYQRRAAVLRIGRLVREEKHRGTEAARQTIDALVRLQAFPIAYELWLTCSQLSGADGRRARAAGEQWKALIAHFDAALRSFWDGASTQEPTAAMLDDERVQLLVRTRDLSDEAIRHLSAVIGGADGVSDRRSRASLLRALLYAGDPRLVPALRDTIEAEEDELVIPAARVLCRIEDPRGGPVLQAAYERTAMPEQRLVLAGALGTTGDGRGLEYVRQVLSSRDDRLLPYALDALCELGGRDEVQAVIDLLERREPHLLAAAVHTLGRIGDSRALLPLERLVVETTNSALRAAVEDAIEIIAARMELLGEVPPAHTLAAHTFDTAKHAAHVRRSDPAGLRMRAHVSLWLGYVWHLIGASTRAIARFETAAALRPDWVTPVLEVAMLLARGGESAQALASFRRALGLDRSAVEASAPAVGLLAQAFLRRADDLERDGRDDIARGLIDEALSIDLRKAPVDLRFALEQRLPAQRDKR